MNKYQEIYLLRKTDKAKAYEMAVSYHDESPGDKYISVAYAWTLYDRVKDKLATNARYEDASMYINTYLDLDIERPSMVHSQFLYLFEKLSSDCLFHLWKIMSRYDNFEEKDWEPYEWQGKMSYGIAHRMTLLWARSLASRGPIEPAYDILDAIETAFRKGKYKVELNLIYVDLLLRVRRNEEAEAFWIPFMREKVENYKDWITLAEIYECKREYEKAMSCYCKALTFPVEEKYLSKTRSLFGQLLHRLGKFDEAKTEIIKSKEIRDSNQRIYQTSFVYNENYKWFKKANEKADNISFYHENAVLAEKMVYAMSENS